MFWLGFLIIFPLAAGLILLAVKNDLLRTPVVKLSAAVICAASIALLVKSYPSGPVYFPAEFPGADRIMFAVELAIAGYIVFCAIKFKRPLTLVLIGLQTLAMLLLEFTAKGKLHAEHNLFIDNFSVIMALIIGIVGTLICVYAIGYMRDFHEHFRKEVTDRRRSFFFINFVFLSAMFGIVFSNNLLWLYFFWEITTVCSFVLIGYKKNGESIRNSFLALDLNLLGGLAFAAGIIYLHFHSGTIELDKVLSMGKAGVLLPVALLCFAGMVKSAQLPFSPWLTGAMVAPTPVSALLHSSTMVKAGVYLILRFSLLLQGTFCGIMIAFVGGTTFLVASFIAMTASDAKKVLAYSTIANLGLIVLCAGVGTYEAVWAAILLIIFHALAKCLLFLCVGVVEHKIHSRDIEDMSGLVVSMPRMSVMMQIGIAGMFLAPFGMLISKWAVLRALVDYNPLLAIFVVFGGAATLFFWVKWMGKLITVMEPKTGQEETVSRSEWVPLYSLSFLTIAICGLFPAVSHGLIDPYIKVIYGKVVSMGQGNITIMLIMLGMVCLFPLSFINLGKKVKVADSYLGGANAGSSIRFQGALGQVKEAQMQNYYLGKHDAEVHLLKFGSFACAGLILIMFIILR